PPGANTPQQAIAPTSAASPEDHSPATDSPPPPESAPSNEDLSHPPHKAALSPESPSQPQATCLSSSPYLSPALPLFRSLVLSLLNKPQHHSTHHIGETNILNAEFTCCTENNSGS